MPNNIGTIDIGTFYNDYVKTSHKNDYNPSNSIEDVADSRWVVLNPDSFTCIWNGYVPNIYCTVDGAVEGTNPVLCGITFPTTGCFVFIDNGSTCATSNGVDYVQVDTTISAPVSAEQERQFVEAWERMQNRTDQCSPVIINQAALEMITRPMFEVATQPMIRLSDIKARRFRIIDQKEIIMGKQHWYSGIKRFFARQWRALRNFHVRLEKS